MEIDLGRAFDALPAMVWTALPDGHIDFINRRWTEYTGLERDDAHGWEWQAVVEPHDLPQLLERWRSIVTSGEADEMEARVRRFDGQYRWFHVQCSPMHDDAGRVVKWYGINTDIDDRKRAEETLRESERSARSIVEALRASETNLRKIIDSIPGLVCTMNGVGEVELLSRPVLDYFGQTPEELKGWQLTDAVHPDDLPGVITAFTHSVTTGDPYDIEHRCRRADGVYRWFQVRALPVRSADGRITGWYVVLVDIDDRKRAEDALRASERQLRLIVDTIPGLVAVFGPHGEVEGLNEQFLEYLGQSQEEFANWATNGTVHADDLVRHVDTLKRSLETGLPIDFETRLRRFDGVYRWVQVRGDAARDAAGDVVRWYCLMIDVDERKRTEEALRQSERNARLIVDSIPGMVAVFAAAGELELVNPQVLDFYGKTLAELQGWGAGAFTHPDDLPVAIEAFKRSLASGEPFEIEVRARRFDGVYRWLQSRGFPAHDPSGRIVRWYNLLIDIDERKRAEETLAARERSLNEIINTIPVLAWSVRPDGSAEFFNQHYLDYVGLYEGQSQYWDLTAGVHPDDLGELAATWQAILASGQPGEAQARLRRFDRQYRWFLFRANPLRDDTGNIVKWYGTNTDIDDRKRAEEALERSEAFLAEGQHLAKMGNFFWRVTTGEIIWSDQLYRIFEFDPSASVTLDLIGSRVHPEDLPLMGDMIERAQRGESDFEYQHRIVLPDRSIKHLHLIAHRSRDHPDQLGYIGAVLDITQRRLAEEALGKARSELAHVTRITSLGALTASIAHEVNQPLSGIVTNASTCLRMLAADPPNVEGARETARRTIRDGNRAADVITRLRALFSKKAITIEPLDLNEAVREVIALSWGDLQRGRVALRTELAVALSLVGGDRIQLQQVIMNLLRNAADAMSGVDDRPRRLLVRTEPDEDDHVCLSIEDTGVGFGTEDAERLFEAFYTTKNDGMGIGLSVSRSIIQSHNGRLWAKANDGPGATFFFSIPRYSGDAALAYERGAAHASIDSHTQNAAGLS